MNSCSYCNQDDSKCIRDRCVKCCDCGRDITGSIGLARKSMKLYVDYCPRCPRPATETLGYGHGPPDPAKCRHCSPKSFTDYLGQYVEAGQDIEKLQKEVKERNLGIQWYRAKQNVFYTKIKTYVKQGAIRVIALFRMAVVLDRRGESLIISSSELEKDPSA